MIDRGRAPGRRAAVAAGVALLLAGGLILLAVPRGAVPPTSAGGAIPPTSAGGPASSPATAGPWSSQALGASPSPPPPARDERAGVAIPGIRLLYADPAPDLDRVAALGVGWVRFDAAWSEIEIARGAFDWTRLDRGVAAAHDRGLSVLLILGTTARWARPPGAEWHHGPATPEQRAGFASFASRAATRYRGRVAAWEIWNEPNLPIAWSPAPDPEAYHALLAEAYPAIHAAAPGAVVLSGGTGGGPTGMATLDWYRALYDLGLRGVCDAVAVHPYPDAPDPDSGEMAAARRVRTLMNERGDAGKPLWGTETGAPTGGSPSIDERAQATLLRALYLLWRELPGAGPLLYYTLRDFGGTDREAHFGLLRADGVEKLAYDAFRDRSGP
ncbi:cellulase family glycosylhydrolase [Catenuloplanes sp. NPDC051500]|uniref:cellulase family glycosylhydrolase n=1 Tax=Catenuloplanes sp. NPDC051500 TaxID=3363959 RepID=UPI0037A37ACA